MDIKFDHGLLDAPLSELGVQQCMAQKAAVHAREIDLVVISPMRRATLTACLLFQDHPRKPRIVV